MRAIFKHRPEIEALDGGTMLSDAFGELVNAINTQPLFVGTRKGTEHGVQITSGNGTPENKVIGSPGDLYLRQDGGTMTTFYVKCSGVNSTKGWVGK